VDLGRLIEAALEAQRVLGRPLGSHTIVAGPVEW
jgi:hydroxymethylglutaryl-CoA lyase